jgi:hypothetical protein
VELLLIRHEETAGQDAQPQVTPRHNVRRAPRDVAKPAPQHEVILTGMVDEAAAAGMVDE